MNEFAPKSNEQQRSPDLLERASHEQDRLLPDHEHAQQEKTEVDPLQRIADARAEASVSASESNPLEFIAQQDAQATQQVTPKNINPELKKITLDREIRHIQRRESAPARALSKVIHQPAVRAVSEATGRTISRPSGLLGGGVIAFLGTSSYLYIAKHYGLQYNYMIFLALFAGGFAAGIAVELILWFALSQKRHTESQ